MSSGQRNEGQCGFSEIIEGKNGGRQIQRRKKGKREMIVYGFIRQQAFSLLLVNGEPLEDFQQQCDIRLTF